MAASPLATSLPGDGSLLLEKGRLGNKGRACLQQQPGETDASDDEKNKTGASRRRRRGKALVVSGARVLRRSKTARTAPVVFLLYSTYLQ